MPAVGRVWHLLLHLALVLPSLGQSFDPEFQRQDFHYSGHSRPQIPKGQDYTAWQQAMDEKDHYCPPLTCQVEHTGRRYMGMPPVQCAPVSGDDGVTPVQRSDDPDAIDKLVASGYHTRHCLQVRGEKNVTVRDLWKYGSLDKAATVIVKRAGGVAKRHDKPVELQYFAIRGLAELPRLILEQGEAPYIGFYYGREDFKKHVKPTLPFGRLPVLRSWDEETGTQLVLAQSTAIVRHLARQNGLAYADSGRALDRANVDSWFETHQELFVSHGTWGKSFSPRALKETHQKNGRDLDFVSFQETTNRQNYTLWETSRAALNTFEVQLKKARKENYPWLLGPKFTYVDLALWSTLVELEEEDHFPNALELLALPELKRFKKEVEDMKPNIQAYLKSDRRLPRTVKEDGDYKYIPGKWAPQKPKRESEL